MPRRVLIVDDERGIADSLKIILSVAGYDCAATYGAREAIHLLETFEPDLVITDVVMPGMNGIELASHLRATRPALPVLLLSGNASTQELLAGSGELRSLTLIPKPYSPRELLRIIAQATSSEKPDAV